MPAIGAERHPGYPGTWGATWVSWIAKIRIDYRFSPLGAAVVALPFCHLTLKAAKPTAYQNPPESLGDHLKKRNSGLHAASESM
jgi:hypothetical protein